MSDLVGLLGTLSALLTLVGTYRFASFFFNRGAGLAALLAFAATAAFLILFEPIILLVGLATVVSPVAGLLYWKGVPSVPFSLGGGSGGGGGGGSGGSTGTSGGGVNCRNCGEENDPDATFCDDCGWRLDA